MNYTVVTKQMDPSQRKFLKERLSAIRCKHNRLRWNREDNKDEPDNIRAARRLVKSFDEKRRKAKQAREKKTSELFDAAEHRAQEAILFGTPDDARAALDAFEKLKF